MKTSIFYSKLNSKMIEENINKHFGVKVDVSPYNREQLEDIRNKLRTKIFNHENGSKFNDLLNNESYQKDKAMLNLVNTRIKEMLGENSNKKTAASISEARKKTASKKTMAKKDYDGDGKIETNKDEVWGSRAKAAAKSGKPFKEAVKKTKQHADDEMVAEKAVSKKQQKFMGMVHAAKKGEEPASPEVAKAAKSMTGKEAEKFASTKHKGLPEKKPKKTKEPVKAKTAVKKAPNSKEKNVELAKLKKKPVKESLYRTYVRMVNENIERLLNEDEEERANTITAAGDMANDYTSWMQKVGQYQTKVMIELSDEIRHNFGAQQSMAFKQAVGPALATTLATLNAQREVISKAIASLAGEETPEVPMGGEPGEEITPTSPDMMNPEAGAPAGPDEFAASDAAAGEGDTGRELRESNYRKKLRESHILLAKLSQ
jgi:hypothetical protein